MMFNKTGGLKIMFKRLLIVTLTFCLAVIFLVQETVEADPQWREKQQALCNEIGLQPGDIIKQSDWKRLDGLLPFSMVEWVKKGYLGDVRIAGFKYDISTDDEWIDAGSKNAGKYKLDEGKNLVDAATGEPPLYIYGIPFPNLDIKKDPDGASKYIWNRVISMFRAGQLFAPFTLEWIGAKGFERIVHCSWTQYCYWARPDGEVANPNKYRYVYLTEVTKPYDLAGIAQLTFRRLDGKQDDFYVYIPAIRRIKKMSGANRSDPYVGSDLIIDDGGGFAGQTNSMKWKFIEERLGLLCVEDRDTENPNRLKPLSEGGWRVLHDEGANILGWQIEEWKGAPWAPVNAVWIPRYFYIIEAMPVDPYYNSGKSTYWIDKVTYHTAYKVVWDKAGDYWKTINFLPRCLEWGDKRGYHAGGTAGYQVVDEKLHHATGVRVGYIDVDTPDIDAKLFRIDRLRTLGK